MKTDIWMPVFIGDYLADTMHLSTEQHGAYLLLLFHLWRKGSLRDDDAALGKICGLGARAWKTNREVLAEFFKIEDGLWQHGRVEKEKLRVAAQQSSRSSKAKGAALARWGKQDAPGIARAMPGDADSDSDSQAHSQAEFTEQRIPPAAEIELPFPGPGLVSFSQARVSSPAAASSYRGSFEKPVADPRHVLFRGVLAGYWRQKNHAAPEMPWQGRDAKALSEFLKACPHLEEAQFRQLLSNRARSPVAHGDRVYLWIGNLTRYQEEMTIYNKPASAGGSYPSRAEINRNSVVSSVEGAMQLARAHAVGAGQAGAEPAAFDDAGMPAVDGAGPGGCSIPLPGERDQRLAAGNAADGPAGADGSLSHGEAVTRAGGANAMGRQEVSAW